MDWSQITTFLVGGGVFSAVTAYVAIRMLKPNIRKLDVDAVAVASKTLIDFINATTTERAAYAQEREKERAAFAVERDNFTKRIDAMEAEQETHRIARDQEIKEIKSLHKEEIDELKARIQSDLIDTRELRAEHAEKEKRVNRLENIAIKQSEYIDAMKIELQKAGIPVPLNGELLESARRLKLSREERERLKAGK